jgi:streptomycin 6-kinase
MNAAALERLLRRLSSSTLLELADAIRKAALLLDRGRPDDGLAALAAAAELLGDAPSPSPPSTPTDAITLLDRARFDLERGWHAAAYDCAARATHLIAKEARNGR